ncbi:alpha-L-glutamate ligase [candidate division WWE3 bacterium]|uniref:Alpha-L-glutamate ligase n=1 Tax=candidate division WWE3 bacterium TaxID=2053526 RepID=A0A955LH27_UNCKA|nr:alpha-L-glutamate ligase [candidate division WWE3 bacterium]
MNTNIRALQVACDQLGLSYEFTHKTKNVLSVFIGSERYIFANWATPLNTHAMSVVCRDKDFLYSLYEDVINMPQTQSFLDPNTEEKYEQYLDESSYDSIIETIEKDFSYPMIIKKNRGSFGRNVFKVDDHASLLRAVSTIFDHESSYYDYILIAQDYIEPQTEYRAIFLDGVLQFVYEKNIDEATFVGNLSPLHWENAKAIEIKDTVLLERIESFARPMFAKKMVDYCGLDIILDTHGELWMIEMNASPGYDHFVSDSGDTTVVALYQKILQRLQA